jgi:two-component system sensor histidine kinase YesM
LLKKFPTALKIGGMKIPKNWSLKSQITWSFMVVVLCVSVILSFIYYRSQRMLFEDNLVYQDKNDAAYLLGNMDKQLRLCEKLSDWIFVNRRIETALVRDYSENMTQYDREIPSIQRSIDDHVSSSSVGKYVVILYIRGNNGVVLKSSNPDVDWLQDMTAYSWFQDGIKASGKVIWPGIVDNPAEYRTTAKIIPITRPVIFSDTRIPIGWHVLAFSPALIGDMFEDFRMDQNRSLVILDRDDRVVFHRNPEEIGRPAAYDFSDLLHDADNGSREAVINGSLHIVTFQKSAYSGMTVLIVHSLRTLDRQFNYILVVLIIVFLLTVIMFFFMAYYLSNRLTKPLAAILSRLKQVSSGVFAVDESISGSDEMGQIGRGINEMVGRIDTLMGELIRREHEKSQLEYRVLLNQINPHFIYNVLNSIKVMADIQKIEGISSMASSLGSLLKEISKGAAEQIPIRRELELLDKYLYIRRIRRNGLLPVTYDIKDEEVLDCLIPRFTLQPLAENAISHGLDGTDRLGEIHISIGSESSESSESSEAAEGGDVVIVMRDNGVGIPDDKIKTLFDEERISTDSIHVGLINVDKRIKLFFGSGGLSVESREGEYTKIYIRFPKRFFKKED